MSKKKPQVPSELFEKYIVSKLNTSWENNDDLNSVGIYRLTHNGKLPPAGDTSIGWVLDFLDNYSKPKFPWQDEMIKNYGLQNLLITARRLVYKFAELILLEINQDTKENELPKIGELGEEEIWLMLKESLDTTSKKIDELRDIVNDYINNKKL